jgi:hypothetical protein
VSRPAGLIRALEVEVSRPKINDSLTSVSGLASKSRSGKKRTGSSVVYYQRLGRT